MEKVAIFVDVQNIYYTTKQCHNCHFNYNAFWDKATSNREIVTAIAYAIDRRDEKQKQFQNILKGIGFEVKLKPFIQRHVRGRCDFYGFSFRSQEPSPALAVNITSSCGPVH